MNCENCDTESRTTRFIKGLMVCQACFNELAAVSCNGHPPVSEDSVVWVPVDLWKLENIGQAMESADWTGKLLLTKVNTPVQENNLLAWVEELAQTIRCGVSARVATRMPVKVTPAAIKTTNHSTTKPVPTLAEIGDMF